MDSYINIFALCANCPAIEYCDKRKHLYKEAEKEIIAEFKATLNTSLTGYDRMLQSIEYNDKLINQKNYFLKDKLIKKCEGLTCDYEREIADNTYNEMNEQYAITENKQILYITEQIIKLRIQDFRLQLAQKIYGIMQRVNEINGAPILRLTPGMKYSIDISKQIAELLQEAETIMINKAEGLKNTEVWNEKLEQFKSNLLEVLNNERIE